MKDLNTKNYIGITIYKNKKRRYIKIQSLEKLKEFLEILEERLKK